MSLTFNKVSESPVFCKRVDHSPPDYEVVTYLGQVITDLDAREAVD